MRLKTKRMSIDDPKRKLLPNPPKWLGKYGREEWIERLPILVSDGTIKDIDLGYFAIVCSYWQFFRTAQDNGDYDGAVKYGQAYQRGIATFGSTAKARLRITTKKKAKSEDDDMDILAEFGGGAKGGIA